MVKKPVISYIAVAIMPFNIPVVRRKVSKTEYCNWKNKLEFTTFVDTLFVPPHSNCYVYIRCDCGREWMHVNKTTIPEENLTCTCGRKIIEYS